MIILRIFTAFLIACLLAVFSLVAGVVHSIEKMLRFIG